LLGLEAEEDLEQYSAEAGRCKKLNAIERLIRSRVQPSRYPEPLEEPATYQSVSLTTKLGGWFL
jgi:hypothetical protein